MADGDSSSDAVVLEAFAASCEEESLGLACSGVKREEKKLRRKLPDGPSQERGLGSFVQSERWMMGEATKMIGLAGAVGLFVMRALGKMQLLCMEDL